MRGGRNHCKRQDEGSWKFRLFKCADNIKLSSATPDACEMMRSIMLYADPLEAIALLIDDKKLGTDVLRLAINLIAATDVHLIVQFLDFLGKERLNVGAAKVYVLLCYDIVWKIPGVLRILKAAMSTFSDDQKLTIAWFLVQICKSDTDARANPLIKSMATELSAMSGTVIQAMVNVILPSNGSQSGSVVSLKGDALRSLDSVRALEPLHDNDFPFDFRSIKVIPTADELNTAHSSPGLVAIEEKEAAILDRQFRLLREDMMTTIVEELRAFDPACAFAALNGKDQRASTATANQRKRLYPRPVLVDISFEPTASVLMLVRIPDHLLTHIAGMSRAEREGFMEGPGRRVLAKDALVLFLTEKYKVKCVARIVSRDRKDFLKYHGYFCVGVEFAPAQLPTVIESVSFGILDHFDQFHIQHRADFEDSEREREKKGDDSKKRRYIAPVYKFKAQDAYAPYVYQANSSVFSYEPVLRCLQEMVSVPFREELVTGEVPIPLPAEIPVAPAVYRALKDDPNQLEAVTNALQKRICLIQGPPGTGKTYVGVQIARALIENAKRAGEQVRILCLCYTNHALDDFLLSLHEDGGLPLSTFVRLGMSPKIHEKLKPRCLGGLEQSKFDRLQTRRYAGIKSTLSDCVKDAEAVKASLGKARSLKWTWRAAADFFESERTFEYTVYDELRRAYRELQPTTEEGWISASSDYRWKAWCAGKPDPEGSRDRAATASPGEPSVWSLTQSERAAKLAEWRQLYVGSLSAELASIMRHHKSSAEELQLLKSESKVPVASSAQVLGCTTTSAAKNCDILTQIRPTVVLVEEAAEILEANVLAALGPSVRHLIMIGDHKQLRPKLESYQLRKESGRGIDFDVSLFERLALQPGFPIITLNEQRRMRPEICDLIRLNTYPSLRDHPSVQGRSPLRGVSGNVVFIDHHHHEGADETSALLGSSSKINLHEAGMVREMVRYFMLQGYTANEIVVLTPYLGQLMLIQAELRKLNLRVVVNDLDRRDLQNADVDLDDNSSQDNNPHAKATATAESKQAFVRVATVDNFQGEESRIIIASLVRCNPSGEVGFVVGAERVNVLLSRSRDGLVLIGSVDTLRRARVKAGNADWIKIIDHIQAKRGICAGFPAVCTTHGAAPSAPIDEPNKFDEFCPCGGCSQPCGAILSSCPHGHQCTKFCHPAINPVTTQDVHATLPCRFKMEELCKNGHTVTRECSAPRANLCTVPVIMMCAAGKHSVEQSCYLDAVKNCSFCKTEEKRRIQAAEQLSREALEQQEREAMEHEEVARISTELQRAIQLGEHEERLARLQHEKSIMLRQIEREGMAHREQAGISQPTRLPVTEVTDQVVLAVSGNKTIYTKDEVMALQPSPAAALEKKSAQSAGKPAAAVYYRDMSHAAARGDGPPLVSRAQSFDRRAEATNANISQSSKPVRGKNGGANLAAVLEMLKYAASEQWMQILGHPAAQSTPAEDPPHAHTESVTIFAVRGLVLLAEQSYRLDSDVARSCKKVDALLDGVQRAALCESEEENLVLLSKTVLQYVTFVVYSRNTELPYTAQEAGSSYRSLLGTCKAIKGFEGFPPSWLAAVSAYEPWKVKHVPAASAVAPATAPTRVVGQHLAAEVAWEHCKKEFLASTGKATPSNAVDTLMKMTGLESVKQCVVDQYQRIVLAAEQGLPANASSYNLRCDGNPGTGKTTVARLYSAFLVEVGVLPHECGIKETSGSKLISDGVRGLTTMLSEMKEQGGGVVFVDETYQLNPQTDQSGRQVLDFILPHAEKLAGEYGSVVWVFAGYADRMDKLFEHNPGLPSRFPHKLVFEDYTDEELLRIMCDLMARGGQDLSASVLTPPPPTKAKKPAAIRFPNRVYQASLDRPDQVDEWGNTWSWVHQQFTYQDSFGNISGYGTTNLGTKDNPIVSQTSSTAWLYDRDRKLFYQQGNSSNTQDWYPGSPKPAPPPTIVRPFTAENPKWVRVAVRRLGRMRCKVGFGNARAVRTLFEKSRDRQASRISEERRNGDATADIMQFTRDDLLGPKASTESLKASCEAWKKLQAMTGLKEVKDALEKLIALAVINSNLEDDEKEPREISLNRIFLGNPGTGKTTVAALYGQILCHLGLLSKGDVVLKTSSDFVGSVMGSSENQTRSILAASEGCVLVIDEAYSLNPSYGSKAGGGSGGTQDPYRTAVIDTIVEQVQGRPGEDRAVVMLGYRKEMEDMLAAANPGLSRRFQLENAFEFADYTDNQLVTILLKKCKDAQLDITTQTALFAITQLAKARAMPHFGNAGAVDNLLSVAKLNIGTRQELLPQDFCPGGKLPAESGKEEDIFADLVADQGILDYLKVLQRSVKLAQKKGKDPKANVQYNLLFVGAPGTGKTTIARKMGQVYHSLGVLPTPEVVEIKAADLIAGYVGQSQKKASEMLHRARGKVLFIDEAYQLNPAKGGPFMQEAVDTLVQELTSEELKGQMVVILAGYEAEVDAMLQVNTGLTSRFSKKLRFENFSADRVVELLCKKLDDSGLELGVDAQEYLPEIAAKLCAIPQFGNGRDVETFAKNVFDAYALREDFSDESDGDDAGDVQPRDLDAAMEEMLASRKHVTFPLVDLAAAAKLPMAFENQKAPPPPERMLAAAPALRSQVSTVQTVSEPIEQAAQAAQMSFSAGSTPFLDELQRLLDKEGLNSEAGVARLSTSDLNDPFMLHLANQIAQMLTIDISGAQELMLKWQAKQLDVQDKMREQQKEMEMAKKEKRQALVPIWRCAVCGRADLNYIYCYVSPFIVRYDSVDV